VGKDRDLVHAITGKTGWVKNPLLTGTGLDGILCRDLLVVCIRSEVVYCTGPLQEETGQLKSRVLIDRDKVGWWPF
jgi:hypothetical protein